MKLLGLSRRFSTNRAFLRTLVSQFVKGKNCTILPLGERDRNIHFHLSLSTKLKSVFRRPNYNITFTNEIFVESYLLLSLLSNSESLTRF
jgi:hypothetical protein